MFHLFGYSQKLFLQKMKAKILSHLAPIAIGILMIVVYFLPAFQGKVLQQSDVVQAAAMQHEVQEQKAKTGESPLWTNNLFSGMPAFLIGVEYKNPIIGHLLSPVETYFKSPACYALYYFLGFYVLMVVLGFSPWLSLIGAIMFTFSSYNFVILEAGHTTKARCIGFMPFIIAGVVLLFQRKYLMGAMLTGLFLFFQIKSNHPQITYYMFILLGIFFVYQLVKTIQNKNWKHFTIACFIFGLSAGLAVMANFAQLWVVYEYSKDTMRGGSELTVGNKNSTKNKGGLDKDYAFQWSYGKMETLTLLVSNAYGGATGYALDENSKVYKSLVEQGVPESNAAQYASQMPVYWGPKPFTSGSVYLGAIVCFLFLLGFFVLKDNWRWWMLGATMLTLFLAWGKNLMWFNSVFFDVVPMYNKFRTVEMALVMLQIIFPVMALITLKKILATEFNKEELVKKVQYVGIGLGAFLLIIAIMPSLFLDFHGDGDAELRNQLVKNSAAFADKIMSALKADRESLAQMDAWRSLILVLIAAGALWLFAKQKIKQNVVIAIIGVATLFDLWSIDKRYLNDNKFIEAEEINNNYQETAVDQQLAQDHTLSYRIFNTANPFNDALPSYYHKNIGGYNPAKLGRYQDVIDSCLSRNNFQVYNMLNTKYFLVNAQNGQQQAQQNPGAMGNAWFVDTLKTVNSPREEILALKNFDPHTTAIIDASKFKSITNKLFYDKDSTAKISLLKNDMDVLEYSYNAAKEQLAVFSEVYYADANGKGWQAYVDDKPAEHFRVNYILRGMILPAGNHKIVFKFEPRQFLQGQKISFIGSLLLVALILGAIIMWVKENKNLFSKTAEENLVAATNKKTKAKS